VKVYSFPYNSEHGEGRLEIWVSPEHPAFRVKWLDVRDDNEEKAEVSKFELTEWNDADK